MSKSLWRVTGASVQGAQHKLSCLPNQDALGWFPSEGESSTLSVSIADGHGYPKGVKADVGASLAVQTALDISVAAWASPSSRHGAETFLSKLTGELPVLWKERVLADIDSSPLERHHLERLSSIYGDTVLDELDKHPEVIYGTTVMLAVCTPDYVILAQLGDGNILTVDGNGIVSSPLQADPRLVANHTWSLASPDASSHFRVALLSIADKSRTDDPPMQPDLIMMATDGYVNSYINYEGFEQVGTDVFKLLKNYGIDVLREQLPGWLEYTSEHGSGDDLTAAFVVRISDDRVVEEYGSNKRGSLDAAYSQIPGSILKRSLVEMPLKTYKANQS